MKKAVLTALVILAFTLVACGGSESSTGLQRIEGQITWDNGGTLPAGSNVSVTIVNASLADTTDVLGSTTFTAEGSPPLNFFIEYEAAQVDDRVNYSATVRIEDPDGSLLYVTTTAQFVIEQGQPVDNITILVEPV